MAAPKGNQFWKQADPEFLGKPRRFETPQDLWEAAKGYFQWIEENPFMSVEQARRSGSGKNKQEVTAEGIKTEESALIEIPVMRPYTWEGLYVHLGVCNLDRYKENEDFAGIITHLRNIIYNQKYSGAASGFFNANIIARDLGLADKVKQENTVVEAQWGKSK